MPNILDKITLTSMGRKQRISVVENLQGLSTYSFKKQSLYLLGKLSFDFLGY